MLAKSMSMSVVAGHGGEFGGGSAERGNGGWIGRALCRWAVSKRLSVGGG